MRFASHAMLVLTLGLATRVGAEPTAVPTPALTAVEARFDAGRVDAGTKVTHTYVLRNGGTTALPIVVKAACGCTATDYDPVVPAGGTGKVTVLLDTTYQRGRIAKTIDVSSNDPARRNLTLTLLAESVRPLVVKPTDSPAVRGPVGALQPVEITVSAPDDAPFEILAVEDDPILRARVEPADVGAATPLRRHRVTLTPRSDLAIGSHPVTLTLVTSLPTARRFPMPATVIVAGPLVANPPQLRLRPGMPLAVRITATEAIAKFRVLRAEVSDADFAADHVAVDGEPAWDIRVRYTGKPTRHGPVNAVLKLTTDVPSQPLVLVRLSGKL